MSNPPPAAVRSRSVRAEPESGSELPCQRYDPDLWFAQQPDYISLAKSLCGDCAVREACLAGALDRREAAGVWGGQLLVDGVIVAFKRGRGRPRKNAA
jgi:WhiB family redox-sensing transcriptional regulator